MVGTVLNKGGNKKEEDKKFEAFKGKGVSMAQDDVPMPSQEDAYMYDAFGDDPELAYALKLSMMEEEAKKQVVPDEPPSTTDPSLVISLQLRFADGSRLLRKFYLSHTVQVSSLFIKS